MSGIAGVLSFLTILPVGGRPMQEAADHIHLFPVAGLLIGIVVGGAAWVASPYVDPLIVGVAVAAGLAILTGMHHIDGLADFADGLMARGTAQNGISAMRDTSVGTAGVSSVVLCTTCVVAAISATEGVGLFLAVVVSEVAAKYSMVLAAFLGRAASQGSGAIFCGATSRGRMALATTMWAVPVLAMAVLIYPDHYAVARLAILPMAAAAVVACMIVAVSRRRFGGVTGDVLGATNEICRAASLGVAVSV